MLNKQKSPQSDEKGHFMSVVPAGIEPATQGFSVLVPYSHNLLNYRYLYQRTNNIVNYL